MNSSIIRPDSWRGEYLAVVTGLFGVTALAWAYLVQMAAGMDSMNIHMAMPHMQTWGAADILMLFLMWAVMMVGMMLPTALPMTLVFTTVHRERRKRGGSAVPTGVFVLGYVAVWTLFSALAALLQWGLHDAALLSPMMVSTSALFGGGLFIAAGVFQWTPLKSVCLDHCRTPLGFLMTEWREGYRGAWVMGLRHGLFCTGCCWVLMALLFVGGVMNLLWVAAIAAFVLVEKVAPAGALLGRLSGVLMAGFGLWMIAGTVL